ncbi:MAG: DNA-directed RNA polymerase subunit alpha [Magnetococcus sp. YQC-5]
MHRNWTALIKPRKVEFVGGGNAQYKATLVVEPLERGFGATLGNALRRVLLSSLEGAAISSVRIDDVLHEFGTIPGVEEDVTEILLNLKGVVVSMESEAAQILILNSKKAGVVKAGDIDCGYGIKILNPNHHIVTLNKGGKLNMVMTVTTGKGYVRAMSGADVGAIALDCSYNPVKNVSYKVFNARIGQQTDYDKLIFDIETNGVVSPEDAMGLAAKILQEQLSLFVNFDDTQIIKAQDDDILAKFDLNLFRKMDDIVLSVRSANCLRSEGVVYVGDLVQKTESSLLKMSNFGRKSMNELKVILQEMGLSFGMSLEGWPPDNIEEIVKQMEKEEFGM